MPRSLAASALLAAWLPVATASAQEFLNPNVEGGCSMGTNKTVVASQVGGRSIRLPADGTVGTITFADDAIADGTLDAEVTGSCRQEGNRVTVFAKGRVVNRAAFTSNTQASAGFSLNMRPHAKPFNTDYLLRAAGNFTVTWDRGNAGALGGASAGFSMTNCDPGGNKSFGAGAGPAASGVTVSSATVECRRRSGNSFGFLESDVPISFGASVHQFAGAPQEFAFEGTVVFELLRVGKEIRVVAGPVEGSAGAPFPRPFEVLVLNNGNNVPAGGEAVRFRLLDPGGAEVQAVDATTLADGKASANFTPPAGGIYKVEAVCAACPASSQELGQGSKVVFPAVTVLSGDLTALPGPREGPVGGSIELAFKATEKVLAGGAAQESPIVGTPVGFTVSGPAGDAALSPNPATTGLDGVARTVMTLGSAAGRYEVKATCAACRAQPSAQVDVTATEVAFLELRRESGDGPTGVLREGDNPLVARVFNLALNGGVDGVPVEFRELSHPGMPLFSLNPQGPRPTANGGLATARYAVGELPGTYIVAAHCPSCTASNEVLFTIDARPEHPRAVGKGAPAIDPSLLRAEFNPPSFRMGYGKTTRVCLTGSDPEFLGSLAVSSLRGGIETRETTVSNPLPGCAGRTMELQSNQKLCILDDTLVAMSPRGQVAAQAAIRAILPNSEEAFRLESNINSDCSLLKPPFPSLFSRDQFRCGLDRYKLIFHSEFDLAGLVIGERLSEPRSIPEFQGLRQCPSPPIITGSGQMRSAAGEFSVDDSLGGVIFKFSESEICGVEATQTIFVGQCAFKRNTVQYVFPEGGGIRTRRSDHADGLFR